MSDTGTYTLLEALAKVMADPVGLCCRPWNAGIHETVCFEPRVGRFYTDASQAHFGAGLPPLKLDQPDQLFMLWRVDERQDIQKAREEAFRAQHRG